MRRTVMTASEKRNERTNARRIRERRHMYQDGEATIEAVRYWPEHKPIHTGMHDQLRKCFSHGYTYDEGGHLVEVNQ